MKIVSTASYKQRLLAFLIDYLLISLLVVIIMIIVFLITNFKISRYIELSSIANKYFAGKITSEEFSLVSSEYAEMTRIHDFSKYISSFIIVAIYFLYIPLKFKCLTLGRKIMKCEVAVDDATLVYATPARLAFREIICNYILYYLFGLPMIVLSAIISVLFDKSLVDMISKTRLVSCINVDVLEKDSQTIDNSNDCSSLKEDCDDDIILK